jgi:putative ABC transport system permease protein
MLETLWQDVRYTARTLAVNPAFAMLAILTLALGIGANTGIFSVVNSVLLRPLPYREPDRLVVALHRGTFPVSPADYLDYKRQVSAFDQMAAAQAWGGTLTGSQKAELLSGLQVTANLMPMLGVEPLLGRVFTPDEDQPRAPRVILLSHGLWQRRFGADPAVVGRSMTLSGVNYTVVGVMPPGFHFAPFWNTQAEMWTPLVLANRIADRDGRSLRVFARLKNGVSIHQAQAEMDTVASRLAAAYPDTNFKLGISVLSLREKVVGQVRSTLLILLGAVAFVLLIACANVSNLLLTRAIARRKEMALRLAVGASRLRLIRQLLTESVFLAALGGGAGFLLARWGVTLLIAMLPKGSLPRQQELGIDATVFAFTLLLSIATGFIFGLAPAFQVSRSDLNENLKQGGRSLTGGAGQRRAQSLLVAAEVALALLLLIGAGLMIKTMYRLNAVDAGFNPHNLLTFDVSVAGTTHDAPSLFKQVAEQVAAIPAVESAGAINHLPIGGDLWSVGYRVEGRPAPLPGQGLSATYRVARTGYFQTMQLPLLRGRDFTEEDNDKSPAVVIINEAMANRQWPHDDPVGKRIRLGGGKQPLNIIGVVRNARQSDWTSEPADEIYLAYLQRPNEFGLKQLTFVVRTRTSPNALIGAVERKVADIDTSLPVSHLMSMDQVIADKLWRARLSTLLLGIFAVIALALAAVGIYGVISYSVRQRTQEIGVRMALGAESSDVLRLTLMESLKPVLAGMVGGLALAVVVSRLMETLVYQVPVKDPYTFAVVAAVLLTSAILAAYVPARRAARVDPLVALRYE